MSRDIVRSLRVVMWADCDDDEQANDSIEKDLSDLALAERIQAFVNEQLKTRPSLSEARCSSVVFEY